MPSSTRSVSLFGTYIFQNSAGAPVDMGTCGHVHTKFWQPSFKTLSRPGGTDYSHLSNKREVTLTNFEKFHPPQKKIPPPQNCFFLNYTKTVILYVTLFNKLENFQALQA